MIASAAAGCKRRLSCITVHTFSRGTSTDHVPLTIRLAMALRDHRQLRGPLVLCQADGSHPVLNTELHKVDIDGRSRSRVRLGLAAIARARVAAGLPRLNVESPAERWRLSWQVDWAMMLRTIMVAGPIRRL